MTDRRSRATPRRRRNLLAGLLAAALGVQLLGAAPANAVAEDVPLAGAQLDGVGLAQVVVGDTVYVGGRFSTARPAGAERGHETVPRRNLLAYSLTTGRLKPWAPSTNGTVKSLARSSDGRTIYAAGVFTSAGGRSRHRIAAFSAATGALRVGFHPSLNGVGSALAVHGRTVYVGGAFTGVAGAARQRVAAVDASTGRLKAFSPRVDAEVLALVASRTGRSLVIGGRFTTVDGSLQRGSARVGTALGRRALAWRVNRVVGNNGVDAAIYSLATDGRYVYASGYSYASRASGKRLEGAFKARWSDGAIVWIEDCHGDTYSVAPSPDAVYIAGHPHDCSRVGGFPPTRPTTYHRALAFSQAATHRLKHNTVSGYSDFGGQPAPTQLDWYPDFDTGTATGLVQGPWSVVVSGHYVAYAGEFTTVDGRRQQGLVRFKR